MATVGNHAQGFEQTRKAHRTELAQDYVEVILDLIDEHGDARLTDIALRLGVAHPTASKALRRLRAEGLVILKPYRSVRLTEEGEGLAQDCRICHQTVVAFLVALGLDEATANVEAEGIEHHVGKKTLSLMADFANAGRSADLRNGR